MNLKRRTFLQQLGLGLTALGAGEIVSPSWAGRYCSALAQPTRRKLALLVGINAYPSSVIDPTLTEDVSLLGSVTDVELQRELLQYRFGFLPNDILVLTNRQATCAGFWQAFEDHLEKQVREGDVVLLHFSGYGSQLRFSARPEERYQSLVPIDGRLPTEGSPTFSDILELELQKRLRFLKSSRITTVIDAGSRDLGQLRWGTLRVRSRPTIPTGDLDHVWTGSASLQVENWPGLLLRGASSNSLALEKTWSGFSAGVFTYALTQILWESVPGTSIQVAFHHSSEVLRRWTGPDQHPELTGSAINKHGEEHNHNAYHLLASHPIVDAVVIDSDAGTGRVALWLGGLPAAVLEQMQPGSQFIFKAPETFSRDTEADKASSIILVVKTRAGLIAKAERQDKSAPLPLTRQGVTEKVRVYSRNLELVVALDPNLERIERVDATSAFSGIPFVAFTTTGEQPADCLFGRLPQTSPDMLTASLSSQSGSLLASESAEVVRDRSYGLFSPNRTLIPGTLINREEAVKTAVNRLAPHLQTLLAMKLLRLTDNLQSSQLSVRAALETTRPGESLLLQRETVRSPIPLPKSQLPRLVKAEVDDSPVSPDCRLRFRISNYSERPLYFALFSFDSLGQLLGFVPEIPQTWSEDEAANSLKPVTLPAGSTRIVPENTMDWGIPSSATWVETFLVVSISPLVHTWQSLRQEGQAPPQQTGLRKLAQPLNVARVLLEDLHDISEPFAKMSSTSESYCLEASTWTTLSFRYAVASTSIASTSGA